VATHNVKVSDEVWAELTRIQATHGIDKHTLVDDIIALAGDLDAIAEMRVKDAFVPAAPVVAPKAPVKRTRRTKVQMQLADLI